MKQDILTYINGDFVDFEGHTHPVVICARSTSSENYISIDEGYAIAEREVYIGVAICNPLDAFDLETGKKIAKMRTYNKFPKIISFEPGVVNSSLVKTLLENELIHIQKFPGKYIKGYKEKLENKMKFDAIKEQLDESSQEELSIINAYLEGIDVEKCIKLAKLYKKYS
jgi:hypothetical protein